MKRQARHPFVCRGMGFVLAYFVCGAQACLAQVESRDALPQGYYIYLGPSPGNYPKVKFSIEDQGRVLWHNEYVKPAKPPKVKQPPSESTKPAKEKEKEEFQWEENKSGIIKWKPHPIENLENGAAKLETDFTGGSTFSALAGGYVAEGILRFKLTLYKIPRMPNLVHVRLLDKNGFALMDFRVKGNQFLPIRGTELIEANEQVNCNESAYKRARDYQVIAF